MKEMKLAKMEDKYPCVNLFINNDGEFCVELKRCSISEGARLFINEVLKQWNPNEGEDK